MLQPGAIALVVGATSGIGAAIAEALAARGAKVIIAGRRKDRLEALANKLGDGTFALPLDVRDAKACAAILDRLPAGWRDIAVLVNCAGHDIGGRRRFDHGMIEEWVDQVDTNVSGVLRVCAAVIPGMLARGRGDVVNIGSPAANTPYAGGSVYTASKSAVKGFSRALRLDYLGTGIRVSEITPGLTRTEFAEARHGGDKAKAATFYAQFASLLAPADVARAVLFALDQPAGITVAEMLVMPSA